MPDSSVVTKTILGSIITRNDTSANWATNGTKVLRNGEIAIERLTNGKCKLKIGNGVSNWNSLPYFASGSEMIVGRDLPDTYFNNNSNITPELGMLYFDSDGTNIYMYSDGGFWVPLNPVQNSIVELTITTNEKEVDNEQIFSYEQSPGGTGAFTTAVNARYAYLYNRGEIPCQYPRRGDILIQNVQVSIGQQLYLDTLYQVTLNSDERFGRDAGDGKLNYSNKYKRQIFYCTSGYDEIRGSLGIINWELLNEDDYIKHQIEGKLTAVRYRLEKEVMTVILQNDPSITDTSDFISDYTASEITLLNSEFARSGKYGYPKPGDIGIVERYYQDRSYDGGRGVHEGDQKDLLFRVKTMYVCITGYDIGIGGLFGNITWEKVSFNVMSPYKLNKLRKIINTNSYNIADLQADVGGHDTAISKLQQNFDEHDTAISNLQDDVDGHDTAISQLRQDVDGNGSNIADLQQVVDRHGTSITSLETDVSGHDTAISNLQADFDEHDCAISELNTTVSGHTTALSNFSTAASNLISSINNLIMFGSRFFERTGTSDTFTGTDSEINTKLNTLVHDNNVNIGDLLLVTYSGTTPATKKLYICTDQTKGVSANGSLGDIDNTVHWSLVFSNEDAINNKTTINSILAQLENLNAGGNSNTIELTVKDTDSITNTLKLDGNNSTLLNLSEVDDKEIVLNVLKNTSATLVSGTIIKLNRVGIKDSTEYTRYVSTFVFTKPVHFNNSEPVVYDKDRLLELTGEVSAKKVILDHDITLAGSYTAVGNVNKGSNNATSTLSAKGKSVDDILTEIFTKRLQPSKTNPSLTYTSFTYNSNKNAATVECGTSITSLAGVFKFTPGSYTYGPVTGVTITGGSGKVVKKLVGSNSEVTEDMTISYSNPNSITTNKSVNYIMGDVSGSLNYLKIRCQINHSAGAVAVDNLGSPSSPEVKIAAGSTSNVDSTLVVTPFRNYFYGATSQSGTINSAFIRNNLTASGQAYSSKTITVNASVGATRVIVAVPATCTGITKVINKTAMNADVTSVFNLVSSSVSVEGANGYSGINYKVYCFEPANPFENAAEFAITLG